MTNHETKIQDMSWCPQLEKLYSVNSVVGRTGKVFSQLGSLSTYRNIWYLRAIMMEKHPVKTLEIGLAFGGSALAIVATHVALGRATPGCHTAIDHAQSGYWDSVAELQLESANLRSFVDIIEKHSSVALAELVSCGSVFDLVYIDGSHQFEDVFVDFYFAVCMVRPGGLIVVDDCSDPHISKVLKFIEKNYSSSLKQLSLSNYLPSFRERARYLAGTLIGRRQLKVFERLSSVCASQEFKDF